MSDGDAFTPAEPKTDPATFNLRKWIDRGAMRPVKFVDVYLAAGLEAQIRELDERIAAARNEPQDERLASASPLAALAAEREQLADEMRSSRVRFKFRGFDPGEMDTIRAEVSADAAEDEAALRFFAAQCIEPAGLTWQDFRDMYAAMGEGYFASTIIRTAVAARDGGAVDVPFSSLASEILRTQTSSES